MNTKTLALIGLALLAAGCATRTPPPTYKGTIRAVNGLEQAGLPAPKHAFICTNANPPTCTPVNPTH